MILQILIITWSHLKFFLSNSEAFSLSVHTLMSENFACLKISGSVLCCHPSPNKTLFDSCCNGKKKLDCLWTRKHDDSWIHTDVLNLYSEKYKISVWDWGDLHLPPTEGRSCMCGGQSPPLSPRATKASLHPPNTGVSYPLGPVVVCPIITALDLYWHEFRGNSCKKPRPF